MDNLSTFIVAGGTVFAGAVISYAIGHAQGTRHLRDEILAYVRKHVSPTSKPSINPYDEEFLK